MAEPTTIVAHTTIKAEPGVVWALVSDMARYAEWVENTLSVTRADEAAVGATMEEVTRIVGPWKTVTTWRVSEFDPPHRQVHLGEGVVMARDMAIIIEVAPHERGTDFTLTLRYTPRFGPMGALVDQIVRRSIARGQHRSVKAFASLVAGSGASGVPTG